MSHTSKEALSEGLPYIRGAPKDGGDLKCIVIRPELGTRQEITKGALSVSEGLSGDRWAWDSWRTTETGAPHPDVQICVMNSRCLELVAGSRDRWAAAGNNLVIDMDLSLGNLPPGSRLVVGTAEIEITAEPHFACGSFIERYGRDAGIFFNTGAGRAECLRGRYAKVVSDGQIAIGDRVHKIETDAPSKPW